MKKHSVHIACAKAFGTAAFLAASAFPVAAQSDFSLKLGAARAVFDEKAEFSVAGAPFPGSGATVSDSTTLGFELTYRLSDSVRLGLAGGLPLTATVSGTGSLSPAGELGKVKYAAPILTAQYHFAPTAGFQPYVGAGVLYFVSLRSQNGAVQQFDVDNKFGTALQAGVSYKVTPTISVFADYKKLFVKTDARGVAPALGGAPVSARVTLNPSVYQIGVGFDF